MALITTTIFAKFENFNLSHNLSPSTLPTLPNRFSVSLRIPNSISILCSPAECSQWQRRISGVVRASVQQPLDLSEENVQKVLIDARSELVQLFDTSVGITGEVDLADLDGPFVKLRLKGRFWHKRSTVLARIGTYLKTRIPEILEVDIEDEKQLDDSPENF